VGSGGIRAPGALLQLYHVIVAMRGEPTLRGALLLLAVVGAPGCGSSRTLPGGDVSPTLDQQVLRDSSADVDLSFPAVLEGVWLVGWSDKMHHYSWVRFARMATPLPPSVRVDAWILAGDDIVANVPLWRCSGKAAYWMGAAGNTIYLDFPSSSCLSSGSMTGGYVFTDISAPSSGPGGAILSATVTTQATLEKMKGFKFPSGWCDAAMTSCTSPF